MPVAEVQTGWTSLHRFYLNAGQHKAFFLPEGGSHACMVGRDVCNCLALQINRHNWPREVGGSTRKMGWMKVCQPTPQSSPRLWCVLVLAGALGSITGFALMLLSGLSSIICPVPPYSER